MRGSVGRPLTFGCFVELGKDPIEERVGRIGRLVGSDRKLRGWITLGCVTALGRLSPPTLIVRVGLGGFRDLVMSDLLRSGFFRPALFGFPVVLFEHSFLRLR